MRVKIDKRDKLFSLLVRERAEWRCERCGKFYPEGNRAGLECSHFFTRSRRSVRWAPNNAASHCTSCHFQLGGNPLEFGDWIRNHLGSKKAAQLHAQSQRIVRLKKHHLSEIHANLKASWEWMQAERARGVKGRLEFDDPMPEDIF